MFHVITTYDHEAMFASVKAVRLTIGRKSAFAVRCFGWTAAAAIAALLAAELRRGAGFDFSRALALVLLVLILSALAWGDRLNAWRGGRMTFQYRQGSEASFDRKGYTITTPGVAERWRYPLIRVFCETPDYFIFVLDRYHTQIFDKTGFARGTPEAFRDFITRTTGLTVRLIP